MNLLRSLFLVTLVSLLFTSCYDDPDFSDTPRLTDIDVYTKTISDIRDSLVVRVGFEDGDGDIGLRDGEEEELSFEPNPATGEPFWIYDKNDPRQIDFNCRDFRVVDLNPNDTINQFDTVRVVNNEAYFNFNASLFTKEDGEYQEVDLVERGLDCGAQLGGRVFPLKDDLDSNSPLKGVIQWSTASAYSLLYKNDTLRIDIAIRDRAGNVSNVITFDDFTLDDVRRLSEEE